MAPTTKVLSKKLLYQGFNGICEYKLHPPSLAPEKEYAAVMTREVLHTQNSVVVLIFAPDIDSFVLCQQFRTGVFFNASGDDPFILECVAGMLDANETPETCARREVMEESGLPIDDLSPIATVYASPGRITEKNYVFMQRSRANLNLAYLASSPRAKKLERISLNAKLSSK